MEGTESELVFDSLNLNPQQFVNETLNRVDDLVDEAFGFFRQEASSLVRVEGTDKSRELSEGIDYLQNMIHSVLDKRLQMWELYSLRTCFAVPDGFSRLKNYEPVDGNPTAEDICHDLDLDAQLEILRDQLDLASQRSVMLNTELQKSEAESNRSDQDAGIVREALLQFDLSSLHDMFKEMAKTASDVRMKIDKLEMITAENTTSAKLGNIQKQNIGFQAWPSLVENKYLSDVKDEEIQTFLAELKRM